MYNKIGHLIAKLGFGHLQKAQRKIERLYNQKEEMAITVQPISYSNSKELKMHKGNPYHFETIFVSQYKLINKRGQRNM